MPGIIYRKADHPRRRTAVLTGTISPSRGHRPYASHQSANKTDGRRRLILARKNTGRKIRIHTGTNKHFGSPSISLLCCENGAQSAQGLGPTKHAPDVAVTQPVGLLHSQRLADQLLVGLPRQLLRMARVPVRPPPESVPACCATSVHRTPRGAARDIATRDQIGPPTARGIPSPRARRGDVPSSRPTGDKRLPPEI